MTSSPTGARSTPGAEIGMGRRVLIGCLALLAVAWPAFAQVPRPKPVLHAAAPSPPPAPESPAQTLVIQTDEEWIVARETVAFLQNRT